MILNREWSIGLEVAGCAVMLGLFAKFGQPWMLLIAVACGLGALREIVSGRDADG